MITAPVITDSGAELATGATVLPDPQFGHSPSVSACAPYRGPVELGLSRGRNAMAIRQDLVDTSGFAAGYQSVRGFLSKLQPSQSPESRAVIETAPGKDYGKSRVMVRGNRHTAPFSGESPRFVQLTLSIMSPGENIGAL